MTRVSSINPTKPPSGWAVITGSWRLRLGPQTLWIIMFMIACVGLVLAVVFLIWAVSGFVSLRSIGLSGSALAGLTIGIVMSAGLGAGLMALVFLSDRDGQDDEVYRASDPVIAPAAIPAPANDTP